MSFTRPASRVGWDDVVRTRRDRIVAGEQRRRVVGERQVVGCVSGPDPSPEVVEGGAARKDHRAAPTSVVEQSSPTYSRRSPADLARA
jgi:hypothetical protein